MSQLDDIKFLEFSREWKEANTTFMNVIRGIDKNESSRIILIDFYNYVERIIAELEYDNLWLSIENGELKQAIKVTDSLNRLHSEKVKRTMFSMLAQIREKL